MHFYLCASLVLSLCFLRGPKLSSHRNVSSAAAALTGHHQGNSVLLIVVAHDNLTVVSAWVVGTEAGDLHGSIQRVGSVSWQHDATTESLIHLDYIALGTEREVSSLKRF